MLQLSPHPAFPISFPITVSVDYQWKKQNLRISFYAQGDTSQIKGLSNSKTLQSRKNELWKTTCFEAFLKPKTQEHYWEINLNSSGDWNFYFLEAYRKNLIEETQAHVSSFQATLTKGIFHLEIETYLPFLNHESIWISPCVILESQKGEKSYWSIHHPESQPNFHASGSFVHELKETS